MNLVAKECVAAGDPADPGVPILSHVAGAAEHLAQALPINPHDAADLARAIDDAPSMPLEGRRARHDEMPERVKRQDVSWWPRAFPDRPDAAEARVASAKAI